jgi:hypothetical protein
MSQFSSTKLEKLLTILSVGQADDPIVQIMLPDSPGDNLFDFVAIVIVMAMMFAVIS